MTYTRTLNHKIRSLIHGEKGRDLTQSPTLTEKSKKHRPRGGGGGG